MAVKCEQLIYSPVNALSFRITGGTKSITAHRVNGEIKSLETLGDVLFDVGAIAEINELEYNIKYIDKKYAKGVLYYDVSMAKRTKSSTFIMPMLGGSRRLFFWTRLFLNCFIKTYDESYQIALLYRWSGDPLFLKFENALSTFKSFEKVYEPTDNTVLFSFNVPKDCKKDFTHFVKGRYSKMSDKYKLAILRFHNQGLDSEIGQILYQDPKRRAKMEERLGVTLEEDSELLSIINIEEETYKIEDYV